MIWTNPLGLEARLEQNIRHCDRLITSISRARSAVALEMTELSDQEQCLAHELTYARKAKAQQEQLLKEYRNERKEQSPGGMGR